MNFQPPSNLLHSVLALNALNTVNSNAPDMQVADMIKSGYFGPQSPALSQPPDVGAVSLQKLRQADAAAVQSTAQSLRQNGFIWLDFTGDVLDTNGTCMASALEEMGNFLAKHEHRGNSHAMEGHFSAAHKDGLRMVTGSWIGSEGTSMSLGTLPASLKEKLTQLAVDLDAAQLEIVNALAAVIGPPQILGEHLDIPLLSEKPEPSSGSWKYGLLDVVRYRMGAESPDEVVAPHADPGLLILSLPCSTPGLQLKDANESWQTPPPGFGVLWAGEAGYDIGFKSGIHRVVASPDRSPRLSAWHELCTRSQLCPPMLQVLNENRMQLKLDSTTGTAEVLRLLQANEDHMNVQLVERRGVPVGKSGAIIREKFVPWKPKCQAQPGWNGGRKVSKADLVLAPGQVEIVPMTVALAPPGL